MLWKIFSSVWLWCWKYHRKHIFYLLLTFSQLPNKYIISFLNPETQIKPRKKKLLIRSRLGTTRGEIVRSRSVLRSRSAQRRYRDQGRRSRLRTIGFGVQRDGGRRSRSRTIQRRGRGRRSGLRTIQRCGRGRRFWSRTIGFGVRRGQGRRSESGSFGFSGFFLSLSLCAHGRVSLSLSFLSVFRKYFEVKMKA